MYSDMFQQGIACLLVQAFYIHRIWLGALICFFTITRHLTLLPFSIVSKKNHTLTAFLLVVILAEFGVRTTYYAKMYVAMMGIFYLHEAHMKLTFETYHYERMPSHSLNQLSMQIKFAQASSALETAAGLLLASVLIYYLQKSRTGFRRTESVINRIILITIGTGLFPNIFAVLCFVFVCSSILVMFEQALMLVLTKTPHRILYSQARMYTMPYSNLFRSVSALTIPMLLKYFG